MKQPFLMEPRPVQINSSDSTPSQLHEERSLLFFTLLPTANLNSMVFESYSLFFPLTDLAVLEWELVFHARKACALLLSLTLNSLTCCCTGGLVWKQLDLRLLFCLHTCVCEHVVLLYTWGSQKTIWGVWSLLLLVSQSWQPGFVPSSSQWSLYKSLLSASK